MKTICTAVLMILTTGSLISAAQNDKQKQSPSSATASANTTTQAQANAGTRAITLDSGTQIDAEITSALDLKKARPGDSFKMKTTRPVKKQGKEIISKGSTITGHVQQSTTVDKTTQATLVFDQLKDNKTHLTSSLSAVVTTIAKPVTATAMTQEDTMATVSARGGATQQSGGLLGGVTQTVSGVGQTVGGVTQNAGGVAGQAGATVSSTTNATLGSTTAANGVVGGSVGGLTRGPIQIVNDTTAAAASGSTLTMPTRNSKLETGTQFMLQTTSALTLTKEPNQK